MGLNAGGIFRDGPTGVLVGPSILIEKRENNVGHGFPNRVETTKAEDLRLA